MIEPVALQDFFTLFFAAALVIMAGASYALLYAWSKTNPNFSIKVAAYVAYAILLIAIITVSRAANFSGSWQVLTIMLAIGYFFAPIGIWQLCIKTHTHNKPTTQEENS